MNALWSSGFGLSYPADKYCYKALCMVIKNTRQKAYNPQGFNINRNRMTKNIFACRVYTRIARFFPACV